MPHHLLGCVKLDEEPWTVDMYTRRALQVVRTSLPPACLLYTSFSSAFPSPAKKTISPRRQPFLPLCMLGLCRGPYKLSMQMGKFFVSSVPFRWPIFARADVCRSWSAARTTTRNVCSSTTRLMTLLLPGWQRTGAKGPMTLLLRRRRARRSPAALGQASTAVVRAPAPAQAQARRICRAPRLTAAFPS